MRETVAMTLAWRQISRLIPLSILGRSLAWLGLGDGQNAPLEWIDWVPAGFLAGCWAIPPPVELL